MTRAYLAYWACITNSSVWVVAGVWFWAGAWLALGLVLLVVDRREQRLWPWSAA